MIVVESKRDQRVPDLLAEQVGHEDLAETCAKLADALRIYSSNVAKMLGLVPHQRLAAAAKADASAHLEEIARLLGMRSCT
jgi:hypothetical protein